MFSSITFSAKDWLTIFSLKSIKPTFKSIPFKSWAAKFEDSVLKSDSVIDSIVGSS